MARTMPPLRRMQRLPLIYIDVPALPPGTAGAYAFAALIAAIATALRVAIDPYIVGSTFITAYPAVVIISLISGFGAGVFCAVLTTAAAAFFMVSPRFSFYMTHLGEVVTVLMFFLVSVVNVILISGLRFAVERYQESQQRLEAWSGSSSTARATSLAS